MVLCVYTYATVIYLSTYLSVQMHIHIHIHIHIHAHAHAHTHTHTHIHIHIHIIYIYIYIKQIHISANPRPEVVFRSVALIAGFEFDSTPASPVPLRPPALHDPANGTVCTPSPPALPGPNSRPSLRALSGLRGTSTPASLAVKYGIQEFNSRPRQAVK